MSRLFEVYIMVRGITAEQLLPIAEKQFGIGEIPDIQPNSAIVTVSDYISLCGGEKEEEAHKRLAEEIYRINPNAKVQTYWTYLEELPSESFGDDFDSKQ